MMLLWAMMNVQKSFQSCNSFGLGAISDKLIFDKVVFVENKALRPMHE